MKTFALSLLAIVALATRADAGPQYPRVSANTCNPTSTSGTTWGRGLLGFINTSTTTSLSATCALPIAGTSLTGGTLTGTTTVRVYYNDNNGVSGNAFNCTAYMETTDGTGGFAMGTKYSCATPGGCTSSANTFVGAGYLDFTTTSSVVNASDILVICGIPPIESGWGVSQLFRIVGSLTVQ